jgi:galactofuranose transport system ATP-binding protein
MNSENYQDPVLLQTKNLSKTFGNVAALTDVDFTLHAGEVHALLGENGAGKSTLIKLITGVHSPDSGQIFLHGMAIEVHNPHDAQKLGISPVYQEINLIPTLSVAENIYLGRQPMRYGFIDNAAANRQARDLLKRYYLNIDVTCNLSSYSIAVQQLVAIARGVDMSAKVLILDEPTASLDRNEVNILFEVMRRLKEQGIGIILITHFLDQVYEIADRITILRNGRKVGEHRTSELPRVQLISEMLGHDLSQELSQAQANGITAQQEREVFVEVQNLAQKGLLEPVNFQIKKGEAVGLAGLLGSGRTETALLMFGIESHDEGQIYVKGRPVRLNSPRHAIQHGFALCPEDRKSEGIIGDLTVRENIILALQAKRGWFDYVSRSQQEALADEMIQALHIVPPDAELPARQLSGGNQQKLILARWLVSNPEFLILDEPTRGIDVGAHAEIISLIKRLCKEGISLLVISSELAEIVDYSERVIVMRDRQQVRELVGDEISENAIMQAIAEHE